MSANENGTLNQQFLEGRSDLWVWDLDRVEKWIGGYAAHPADLAVGFCSLKRWLTEHVDEADVRTRSVALTGRFLDALDALGPGAIVNTRYSGTEPVFRVMVQGRAGQDIHGVARQAIRLCRAVQVFAGSASGWLEVKDCTTGVTLDPQAIEAA